MNMIEFRWYKSYNYSHTMGSGSYDEPILQWRCGEGQWNDVPVVLQELNKE